MRVSVASSPPARLVGEAVPALRVLRDSKLAPTLPAIRDLVLQLQENDRLTGTLDEARGLFDRVAAFAVQRRTLATQLEALVHIRSIDNKTGGQVPPLPGP